MYYQFHFYAGKDFFGKDNYDAFLFLCFKIIMPAIVIISPNSMMLSLFFGIEANYINKTMTMPIRFESILSRKYFVSCMISFVMFFLLLPTLFWGMALQELVVAFLFAIGPLNCLLLWNSTFNDKKYDLMENALFNWQGNTAKHYIINLFIPFLIGFILLGLAYSFSENTALWFMAISGLIFVALNKIWISWLAKYFDRNILNKMEKIQ
jgi:hypothetical protein